jgi:hypothetical protein
MEISVMFFSVRKAKKPENPEIKKGQTPKRQQSQKDIVNLAHPPLGIRCVCLAYAMRALLDAAPTLAAPRRDHPIPVRVCHVRP